ncbi:hypothetical protein M885DRAFT_531405 [Pelagophyceae sp. CCMP2097]|nr:hypothetical protein M885DRAFT_531405 [Pelagophyceae sp. CCMP2097]|mmetsp:Transcript_13605/g.45340  ORF Transcript_13605/g.45340 Transcript_13605/m.45340 type:complete len:317 (-) Transcript_13605:228-1178(-)
MGNLFSGAAEDTAFFAEAFDAYDASASKYAPLLKRMTKALLEVRAYGASAEANREVLRDAMQGPVDAMQGAVDEDAQRKALEAAQRKALGDLAPGVRHVVEWFDLALDLKAAVPVLLHEFNVERAPPKAAGLDATRALAAAMAFVLQFDAVKMATPEVQNDFAFVKRSRDKHTAAVEAMIPGDKSEPVRLFIAQSAPFLNTVASCFKSDGDEDRALVRALGCLSAMCCSVLADKGLSAHRAALCCQVMTSSFVIHDRASQDKGGSFGAASPISAKKAVYTIRKRGGDASTQLLSTIRYCSLHYDKASSAVQSIVEA